MYRARTRRRTRGSIDGRALLGAGSDRHGENRGTDPGAQDAVHDCDCHSQHATSRPRFRLHRVLLSWQTNRVRTNGENLHKPRRKTDRRLHHWSLRIIPGPDFGADAKVAMVTPTLLLSTNSSRIRPKLWVFVLKCPKIGSNSR